MERAWCHPCRRRKFRFEGSIDFHIHIITISNTLFVVPDRAEVILTSKVCRKHISELIEVDGSPAHPGFL